MVFMAVLLLPALAAFGSSAQTETKETQTAGSGTWLEGERFSASVSESDLQSWIDELQ